MKKTDSKYVQILDADSGRIVIESARWCKRILCKLIGFQFRSKLRPEETLILVHSKDSVRNTAIHMFFVFTSLGVIWVDSKGNVTHKLVAKPWRPHYSSPTPACCVIETTPVILERFQVGERLHFKPLSS